MIHTACGLDCYDGCKIDVESNKFPKLNADTNNGALCSLVNKDMLEAKRVEKPMVNGVEVSMEEALDAVAKSLQDNSLLWRGSGNFGVMQEVTNLLFKEINGTLTKGSLCDGAGDAGIVEGRGVNRTLPIKQIEKSEVVIIWGRDIERTNSHIMPYLEGKKIVVIDPICTPLAKKADLFIQIRPRSDIYLILMLARFIFMEDSENIEWLDEFASEYEEFYDFTRTFRLKAVLEYLELDLNTVGKILEYLKSDKVVILVGNGVQKYSIGHNVLWAIDSLASTLGLFGKEGCGVSYLGNSKLGLNNPFNVDCKRVTKVATPFSNFDTILIQGGNPTESMPNSNKVINELKNVKNIIYFGLYENKTSQMANIIIPAKNFFEKDDVRVSYGDHTISKMNRVVESNFGISEYDFTNEILKRLNLKELKDENYYIDYWLNQCQKENNQYISPAYQELPYANGFGEDEDDEFIFIDDFEDDFVKLKQLRKYRKINPNKRKKEEYWLITPKATHALNTQFKRDNSVTLHPDLGFKELEEIIISSSYGSHKFIVKNSIDIRLDSIVIRANAVGVNYLTPPIISEEGEGACYQEVKVFLDKFKIYR
jgi:anaerobic selenocysteine-containing dehydrogenase